LLKIDKGFGFHSRMAQVPTEKSIISQVIIR